jgi:hypothetical protein
MKAVGPPLREAVDHVLRNGTPTFIAITALANPGFRSVNFDDRL